MYEEVLKAARGYAGGFAPYVGFGEEVLGTLETDERVERAVEVLAALQACVAPKGTAEAFTREFPGLEALVKGLQGWLGTCKLNVREVLTLLEGQDFTDVYARTFAGMARELAEYSFGKAAGKYAGAQVAVFLALALAFGGKPSSEIAPIVGAYVGGWA